MILNLHQEPERDHRRGQGEDEDQAPQVVHARQHPDDHDHDRRAQRVLIPAGVVDAQPEIAHVPLVHAGERENKVGEGRDEEERGHQRRYAEVQKGVLRNDKLLGHLVELEERRGHRQGEVGAQEQHDDALREVQDSHGRVEQAQPLEGCR